MWNPTHPPYPLSHSHTPILWLQVDSEQCLVKVLAIDTTFSLRVLLTVLLSHGIVTKLVNQQTQCLLMFFHLYSRDNFNQHRQKKFILSPKYTGVVNKQQWRDTYVWGVHIEKIQYE